MTIDGKSVATSDRLDVINPATEQVFGFAPLATQASLDAAVESANNAFPAWSAKTIGERQKLVAEIGDCIAANMSELSHLLTTEQGKTLAGAEWELKAAVYWCHEVAKMDIPAQDFVDLDGSRVEIRHTPIGVVGAITPWNYPVVLAIWKVAPALLAGNTMVLKPSPYTPLTTLRIGELLQSVLPAGVLNVVSGNNDLGQWMTSHVDIGKISFTGSTETGKKIMKSSAETLKRITLELGGNDAAIVLPDVDPKTVAQELFWGAFQNSAQICVAAKRLYIHTDIYDAVAHELVEYAKTITVGDGTHQGVDLGPVQNKMQYDKVKNLLEDARKNGLKFLLGGDVPQQTGYFIPITIVDNPSDDARVVTEEAFGPVLPLLRFDTVDEAIARANDSDFGLGGSVWSADTEEARKVAARLETGTVWINQILAFSPHATFSGHKQSGIGVEGSIQGLLEFTNVQSISTRPVIAAH